MTCARGFFIPARRVLRSMQEIPENTAPEPPVAADTTPVRTASGLRVVLLVALFATGILVGVTVMYARMEAPHQQTSAKKAPRLIKPSTKATQTKAEPAPAAIVAPAKPVVEPITIAGSVVDEFGRAIVDAVVSIGREVPTTGAGTTAPIGELGVTQGPVPAIPSSPTATPPPDAATARTDQDGKFSIAGVQPGNMQLFVAQPGYEPNLSALDALRVGETRDQLYIVLRTPAEALPVEPIAALDPALAQIAGVVLDRLGRPVVGALVETDEGDASAQTDSSGAFALMNVVPGALRIVASDENAGRGESAEVRARAGELLPGVRIHLPDRYVPGLAPAPLPTASRAPMPTRPAPSAPKPSAAPVLQAGVALEQRPNSVVVSLLDQNSAPSKAGLVAGDILLRIADEPVLSASQARGMLRDPAGTAAKAHILRGKKRLILRWKRPGIRFAPTL